MSRVLLSCVLVIGAWSATGAVAAPAAPTMNAARVIDASAAGAVVASTCARGSAEMHRRNAQESARGMLKQQRMLPADFDARFLRAWAADARRMKAMTPAQRKAVCKRLEGEGMRFRK